MDALEEIMSDKEGLIFDFDGTLVKPLPVNWEEVMGQLLEFIKEKYDVVFDDARSTLANLWQKARIVEQRSKGKYTTERVLGQLSKKLRKIEMRTLPKVSPILDFRTFFSSLKDKGYVIAIFSSNSGKLISELLKKHKARRFVETIVSRENVVKGTIEPKPSPAGLTYISNSLNLPLDKSIFFGDTSGDMKAAAQAGVFGVGVLSGYEVQNALLTAGGGMTISSLKDLDEILGTDREDLRY